VSEIILEDTQTDLLVGVTLGCSGGSDFVEQESFDRMYDPVAVG
jgi:hypothetical protein